MRVHYSGATEAEIKLKIGAFLAQSSDRDGGRKERAIKQQTTDTAADISAVSDAGSDVEADDEHE